MAIADEEARAIGAAFAKVVVANGSLPKKEVWMAKYGPWSNLVLSLAAVYGPRVVMLWKMWETERARQKRAVLTIVREESAAEAAPGVDPSKAVN